LLLFFLLKLFFFSWQKKTRKPWKWKSIFGQIIYSRWSNTSRDWTRWLMRKSKRLSRYLPILIMFELKNKHYCYEDILVNSSISLFFVICICALLVFSIFLLLLDKFIRIHIFTSNHKHNLIWSKTSIFYEFGHPKINKFLRSKLLFWQYYMKKVQFLTKFYLILSKSTLFTYIWLFLLI